METYYIVIHEGYNLFFPYFVRRLSAHMADRAVSSKYLREIQIVLENAAAGIYFMYVVV